MVLRFTHLFVLVAIIVSGSVASAAGDDPIADLSALDRATQLAAVDALIASDEDPKIGLLRLWRTTDRSDVRAMVARVLARRSHDGVDTLLAIASIRGPQWTERHPEMIAWALAPHGEPGVLAFVDADPTVASAAGRIAVTAASMAGMDLRDLVADMISSKDPRRQAFVLRQFRWSLDAPQTSMWVVEMCRRGDLQAQGAAARALPVWTAEQREVDPRGFREYQRALEALLSPQDAPIAIWVMEALAKNGGATPNAAGRLKSIAEDPSAGEKERTAAMRLLVAIDRAPEAQAEFNEYVVAQLEQMPRAVGRSLALLDPDMISDEILRLLIESPDRGARNDAFNGLMRPFGSDRQSDLSRQVELSRRLAPLLIEQLRRGGDDASSAAAMLGWLRRPGPEVVEALLVADSDANGHQWAALLRFAPDDPRFRAVIESAFRPEVARNQPPKGAQKFIMALRMHHGNSAEWIGQLLRPVAQNPDHPWRELLSFIPSPDVLIAMDGYSGLVIPAIVDDSQRREWQRSAGRSRNPNTSLLLTERELRKNAAEAIRKHPLPSSEEIDALLEAIFRIPLDKPTPRAASRAVLNNPRYRATLEANLYDFQVGQAMARALAQALMRRPQSIEPAIRALANRPTALALTLAARVKDADGDEAAFVPVPVGLDDRLQAAVFRALSRGMDRHGKERYFRNQAFAVALARAPLTDPAILARLLSDARTASTYDAINDAVQALGHYRPVTPDAIETIREAVIGPPRGNRVAAIQGAAALGPEGLPLLEDLMAAARKTYTHGHLELNAIRAIAPDDPRIDQIATERGLH